MLAAYGIDILEPRVTLRRIWTLARRLPPGAWPDHRDPMHWTIEAHLLASVLDALAGLTYVTVKAAGGKPSRPKPWPRPKRRRELAPADGKRGGTWADVARALVAGVT